MNEHITITRSEAHDLCDDLSKLVQHLALAAQQADTNGAPHVAVVYRRQQAEAEARYRKMLSKLEGGK